VKYCQAALAIAAALSASLALAEDFKTINSKEYKNATVTRVEADGIIVRTAGGISKIYFVWNCDAANLFTHRTFFALTDEA